MQKAELEEKLKNFEEFSYPSHVSKQAKHLIAFCCQKSIYTRFSARGALKHPWITRRLDEELPQTEAQQRDSAIGNIQLEAKLRKAMNVLMFCSITKKLQSPKSSHDKSSATTREETQ